MDTEITQWYRKPNSSWWNSEEPIHGLHVTSTWQGPVLLCPFSRLTDKLCGSRTRNYYKADDEGNLHPEPRLLTSHCHNLLISQAVKSHGLPWSHQTFRPVSAVKLLGIMFRNRCWPTTFHTITTGDADGWCLNRPVWSTTHASHNPFASLNTLRTDICPFSLIHFTESSVWKKHEFI